jgi:hypothetical protein
MALVKMALGDAKESDAVPPGEYLVQIFDIEEKESSNHNMMTVLKMRIKDRQYPNAKLIYYNIIHATGKEDSDRIQALNTARLLQAFDVPYEDGGFDPDDLKGAEATVELGQEEATDRQGKKTGEMVNRLVLPRLKRK